MMYGKDRALDSGKEDFRAAFETLQV